MFFILRLAMPHSSTMFFIFRLAMPHFSTVFFTFRLAMPHFSTMFFIFRLATPHYIFWRGGLCLQPADDPTTEAGDPSADVSARHAGGASSAHTGHLQTEVRNWEGGEGHLQNEVRNWEGGEGHLQTEVRNWEGGEGHLQTEVRNWEGGEGHLQTEVNEWMNKLYFTRVVEKARGLFTSSPRPWVKLLLTKDTVSYSVLSTGTFKQLMLKWTPANRETSRWWALKK